MSITGLACELASAAERGGDSKQAASLLQALCDQLAASGDDGAAELDEVLLDLQRPLLQSAALSIEAEAAARCLLTVAATVCTAREVFTLCIAALSETLSQHPPAVPTPTHGPASPAFQLFLLATLCRCLPRIRRRPLHFLADALDMQLRWAAEALPSLLLGSGSSAEQPAGISCSSSGSSSSSIACNAPPSGAQPTAAHALAVLARLATHTTAWVHSAEGQLSEQERAVALRLQGLALLQLASIALQLPENLEAAAAALPQAGGSAAPAPTFDSRLPAMRAAAVAVLALPKPLLAAVPAEPAGLAGGAPTVEVLEQLLAGLEADLATCGIDAQELPLLSAAGAAEGAAAAACAAACGLRGGSSSSSSSEAWLAEQHEQERVRFSSLLPPAACTLLDLGAEHRSVALSLLPLCAVCTAGAHLTAAPEAATAEGKRQGDAPAGQLLPASTPPLDALISALVAVMSHNPVQLLRSCAHDALHAVLAALDPHARLAQLRRMMQLPSTASAVVALQRLRQEMATAWDGNSGDSSGGIGGGGSCSLWLSEAAVGLALPCLARGTPDGWHDEGSVAAAADVQAAALSLLRWVLLRERAAPRGASLLSLQRAQALLQKDLLPLQACVGVVLEVQARGLGRSEASRGGSSSGSAAAAQQAALQQAALDSFLAAQRLSEALERTVELLQERVDAWQAGDEAG